MKQWIDQLKKKEWFSFFSQTMIYFLILIMLIYLYHYKNIQGGSFIYNEF